MTDFARMPNGHTRALPEAARRLAAAWLLLGVAALGIAGLFAILLVLARAPGLGTLFPTADFFRTALVVHVDQSVLIWFLAFGGVLWSLGPAAPQRAGPLRRIALGLAASGCAVVAIAPFAGAADPLLNNYVPVLQHPLFHAGLLLFGAGVLIQSLVALGALGARVRWLDEPAELAALTAAVAVLVAIAALAWTWPQLGRWDGHAFFEFLFWGSGHVAQFAYTQLMLAAWVVLAAAVGVTLCVPARVVSVLVLLGVLPLLWVPVIYALHPVDTVQARQAFTSLMQYGGGIAAIPIGLYVVYGLARRRGPLTPGAAPPAPRARHLGTDVRRRRPAGLADLGREHGDPRPLPRVDRRRDAGADGAHLPPAAAARASARRRRASPPRSRGSTRRASSCTSAGSPPPARWGSSARRPAPRRASTASPPRPRWA